MRATVVSIDGNNATVRITPSWLGRMFGCRVVELELENLSTIHRNGWVAKNTGRELAYIDHGEAIRNALDFREAADPAPAWVLRKEQG
jgi:hypothetical protein